MMKRNKAILCALAGIGFITSVGTVKANAMTNTTTTIVQSTLSGYKVVDMIYNLPDSYKLTLGDKAKVEEVRKAYDSLSKDEKSKVLRYDLYYLEDAESTIKHLEQVESDKVKAQDLVKQINELKEKVGYEEGVTVDKEKAKANEEMIKAIRGVYDNLDYSVKYGKNNLITNYSEFIKIECRLV